MRLGFTIRETGETLTLKEQHKTYSSVSKYKFLDKEADFANTFKYPEHDASEDSVTMRVLYKDGHAVTHAAVQGQHLQTASLQYWENIATQKRANDIVRPSAKQAQHSIFTKDSDGDGLVDAIDRHPQEWNVSERDLRMFSSLSYHSPSDCILCLKAIIGGIRNMLLLLRILTTNILAIRPMYLNWLGNGNCLKQVVREVVWIMRFSAMRTKRAVGTM